MSAAVKAVIGVVLVAVGSYFEQPWLIKVGSALLLSAAAQALGPQPPRAAPLGPISVAYSGTLEPRRIIYGTVKTSGMNCLPPLTSGTNNDYFHQVIAIAGHTVDSIGDVYLGLIRIPSANIGAVTGSLNDGLVSGIAAAPVGTVNGQVYNNLVWLRRYTGSQTSADYILTSYFTPQWDSTHVGNSIAYLALEFKFDPGVFGAGPPQPTVMVRGKRVYDPRQDSTNGGSGSQRYATPSTWTYSSNPALCLRDYLTASIGLGDAQTSIDDVLVAAAANVCDQSVSVPIPVLAGFATWTNGSNQVLGIGTDFLAVLAGGMYVLAPNGSMLQIASVQDELHFTLTAAYAGATAGAQILRYNTTTNSTTTTQPRYTCNTVLDATGRFEDNISILAAAMMGYCLMSGGKWRMYAGAWSGSAFSLSEADLVGSVTIQASTPRKDLFNSVRGNFIDPSANWQPGEFPPVSNATDVAQDGETIWVETNFPCCTDRFEVQRNAILMIRQARNRRIVTAQFGVSALGVRSYDTGTLTIGELGWNAQTVRCIGWKFTPAGMVELTLQEAYASDFTDPNPATDYAITGINIVAPNPPGVQVWDAIVSILSNKGWTIGTTGSQANYNQVIGGGGGSNSIILGDGSSSSSPLGPFGTTETLWKAAQSTTNNDNFGFTNSSDLRRLDTTKSYRFSLWVRFTANATGSFNFGLDAGGSIYNLSPGAADTNPLAVYGGLSNITLDKWYLAVGVIHGSGYTGGQSAISGIYDPATAQRVAGFNGFANSANVAVGSDFKFAPGVAATLIRAFTIVASATASTAFFARPRFEQMNGAEPSIVDLLTPNVVDPSLAGGAASGGSSSLGVLPKGSIPPMVQDANFSYTSTSTSINWSWGAYNVYRPDGSSFAMSSGSQNVTGLSASSTYYGYAYSAETAPSTMAFVTGQSGSTGTPAQAYISTASYANLAAALATAVLLGHIFQGKVTGVTPASGTGGGGGGGGGQGCPHPDQWFATRRGLKKAHRLIESDELLTPDGWAPIERITRRRRSDWVVVEFNNGSRVTVTTDHRFIAPDGEQVHARDLHLGSIIKSLGARHLEVVSLRSRREEADAVQIELEYPHLYRIVEDGPLSHNLKP